MLIKPSMRSKLLQILLIGSTPKRSARVTATTNAPKAKRSEDFFGWYSSKLSAKRSHAAKTISITTRQKKALVVMNGKKSELDRRNGIKGIKKSPPKTVQLNAFLLIRSIVPLCG